MSRFSIPAALIAAAGAASAEPGVERGAYLVRGPMSCGNCHTEIGPDGFVMAKELAGRLVEESDQMTAWADYLTPAGEIAGWSDAELARAIREGIRPDGSLIGPPMPFQGYRGLGDEDLMSIVMFLRTLPPVENEVPASEYRIPLPPAWGPPVDSVTPPPRAASVEYGAYLAGPVSHCTICHTPAGPEGPMLDSALGLGGYEFHGSWGTSVASNITSQADGLAGYSDDEVKAMITAGRRPDGGMLLPPMPYQAFAAFTSEDLEAVLLYLRSLPPLSDRG